MRFARLSVLLAALALPALVACGKGQPSGAPQPAASPAPAASAAPHVEADHYKVDTNVPDCAAGAECTATLRLEATGAYHINDTYPYKLTVSGADAGATSDGLVFAGKDAKSPASFAKATGDFERQAEKVGVMTVRFKSSSKGRVAFAGRFKLSVCSEANCELDQTDVSFEGTAK